MITLDFETDAIMGNPLIAPPKPVGLAVKYDDQPPVYHTDWEIMRDALRYAWDGPHDLLFHNAPFDLSVAREHFDMPDLPWHLVHDTRFLIYLADPHAPTLGLKDCAKRIMGWETDSRDELHEWILDNVKGATPKTAGRYICEAPVDLVAKYARQDVEMTYALYQWLIADAPMAAYDVERELMPYLTQATRHGVRVDTGVLGPDILRAEASLAAASDMIFTHLGCEPFDLHNANQLADALDAAGKITEWKSTPTGKRSTSRGNLMSSLDDPALLALLSYTGAMRTCLTTFMRPWLADAQPWGRLHPNWNQVRGARGGTRTGRFSSDSPNFQNIPNEFAYAPPEGCMAVPNMRDYILPEHDCDWVSRDFSAQEMRILAHFENGALMRAFQADPDMDPHDMVQTLIRERTGLKLRRKHVKNIGFGLIYGMGTVSLAKTMGVSLDEADRMIHAYHDALPGVRALQEGTRARGLYEKLGSQLAHAKRQAARFPEGHGMHRRVARLQAGMPKCDYVRTFGGRRFKAERPKIIDHQLRTFEYKLLNYLIQGSAADQTKRCLLRWFKTRPKGHTFMATVHDEINISVPVDETDAVLQMAMEMDDGLAVPMRTTVTRGKTWGAAQ